MAEALNFLQTAVGRAAGIIDALLRLSRAGRVEYRNERVDPEKIVQRVVDAMRGTIKERGVTVRVHPMPPAAGDATAIDQIFGNLIGNAVNYLDPQRSGEIDIGALPASPPATPNPDPSAPALITYYVKDNGLGIPAAYMDKMFRAFQRLHGNIAKGEGIGLALVRRVVERHNGRVWVESQEGTGTTFFVSLPAWTEAPAASPETPSTEPA
jgi:signal transduction histidine kinase